MPLEVLRPGIFRLHHNEMPFCPECGSKDFEFEKLNSPKLKLPAESVVMMCEVCGCVFKLSNLEG